MKCKICANATNEAFIATVLNKYEIQYYQCAQCYFVQTEQPYWINEAYSNAITSSDIGLVNRNLLCSTITKSIIDRFFDPAGKFVDYGGGYGMFVRLMRDQGYDFYRQDKYCENLLAKGFEADSSSTIPYELLTAFEVFEHLTDPLAEIEQMLKYSPAILFSTLLVPNPLPRPSEWWYYGIQHGQHIALYSHQALLQISHRFGLNLVSNGNSIHLLSKQKISRILFQWACRLHVAQISNILTKTIAPRTSLLKEDYRKLTEEQSL